MTPIQSDSTLASQHASALAAAISAGVANVSRDDQTTVAGNQTALETIDELVGLQQQLEGLITYMMGNIQALDSRFQSLDQALSSEFTWFH